MNRFFTFGIFVILSISVVGCKQIADDSGKRQTKSTEELIKQSNELQNLEKICRDLPFFERIEATRKAISRQSDELFYYYQLQVDVNDLQQKLKKELLKKGWVLTKVNDGIWENQIEFEKGRYRIQVTNGNFGESNYGTNCKDSTIKY